MKKRIIIILIAIVMVTGLVPSFAITTGATGTTDPIDGEPIYIGTPTTSDTWDGTTATQAWASGTGTESDPYVIMTAEQLAKLAADVNGGTTYASTYFKLGANLDLAGATYNWTPIGGYHTQGQTAATAKENNFAGVLDGNNVTILNLSSTTTDAAYGYNGYRGLFGNLGGTVMNLKLNAPTIRVGYQYAAGLVAYSNGGTVKNITVTDPTIETTKYGSTRWGVSAIIGYMTNGTTVENCHVTGGKIIGVCPGVGGIAGYLDGTSIKDCTVNKLSIEYTSSPSRVGSVVGSVVNASVTNCHATECSITGTFAATSDFGGIVGYAEDACVSECTVKNATLSVGSSNVGGIVGQLKYIDGTNSVTNCLVEGSTVTSTSFPVGGVVGYSYGNSSNMNTVKNCGIIGGSVTGGTDIGGVVGNGFQTNIIGCYNYGATVTSTITGTAKAGGIVGINASIYSCFSSADVLAPNASTKRNYPLCSQWDVITVNNCAYDSEVYTGTLTQTSSGNKGFTTEQVKSGEAAYHLANPSSSNDNNFTDWKQTIEDQNYPSLTGKTVFYDANATPKYYNKATYAIILSEATVHGSVTANSVDAAADELITLTVNPATGYELDTVTVTAADGTNVPVSEGKFTMPAQAVTVSVTFKETTYTVTFSAGEGEGTMEQQSLGAITPSALTLNTFTRANYEFDGWKDENDNTYTDGQNITLTGNITLTAQWKLKEYSVTNSATNASFESSVDKVTFGQTMVWTIKANDGYFINEACVTITIGGEAYTGFTVTENTTDTACMDINIPETAFTGDVVITVKAKKAPCTIEIQPVSNGSIFSSVEQASEGDTVTLTVKPAELYELETITVTDANGIPITVTDNTFVMPATKVTVTATFKKIEYVVKAQLEETITKLEEELKELINGNGASIEELEAKAEELQKAIDDAKNVLGEKDTELEGKIQTANETLAAAQEEIEKINAAIADLGKKDEELAKEIEGNNGDISELQKKADELQAALEEAKKVLGDKGTELEGLIQKANETLEAARKSLQEQIDALKADIENAMRSISAINTQTTDLINSHVAKLNAAIAAAEKAATDADTALKKELEELIAKAKKEATDATSAALESAKAELSEAIAKGDKASADELAAAIANLNTAIENAKTASAQSDATLKAELEAAIKSATDADAALKAALEDKIDGLETFVIIVCVIAGVSLAGSGAFVTWFFIDRKKKS